MLNLIFQQFLTINHNGLTKQIDQYKEGEGKICYAAILISTLSFSLAFLSRTRCANKTHSTYFIQQIKYYSF